MDDTNGSFTTTLPARKNFLLMGVLTLWLALWAVGVVAVTGALLRGQVKEIGFFVLFFLFAWLAGWSLGGGFALYGLLWMGCGKETIVATSGGLTLTRTIYGYQRLRHYDAARIRSLRVVDGDQGITDFLLSLRPFGIGNGLLTFDYGTSIVTFAQGIDSTQAQGLLAQLRVVLPPRPGAAGA